MFAVLNQHNAQCIPHVQNAKARYFCHVTHTRLAPPDNTTPTTAPQPYPLPRSRPTLTIGIRAGPALGQRNFVQEQYPYGRRDLRECLVWRYLTELVCCTKVCPEITVSTAGYLFFRMPCSAKDATYAMNTPIRPISVLEFLTTPVSLAIGSRSSSPSLRSMLSPFRRPPQGVVA